MSLLSLFQNYIKQQNLFTKKDKLLLAVSGGVDSVVLCELCKQAGFDFVIAHCNFQLRGEESERDEQFVKGLGKRYNADVLVKKFDTENYAIKNKLSIQEAARDLRYSWFSKIINGAIRISSDQVEEFPTYHSPFTTHLLTAHHANDSIETLVMNFFKGTGIKGLQGILPRHELLPHIVRPLLFAKKVELLDFAIQNGLSFVEDSSNNSDKYTRNYFRNNLIPSLRKVYPDIENNLLDNLQRFRDTEILYRQSIELHKKKLLEQKGGEVHIPVLKLLKAEPLSTIIYEIIKEFGFTSHQVKEVIGLLQSGTGKYIQSPTFRIIRNRNWLIISPTQSLEAQNILIEDADKEITFSGGTIGFNKIVNIQSSILNSPLIAQFDAGEIKFPLLLRKWKTGDYFYPLGMKKKKKLARFFIDQKLSKTDKEKSWVLEMDKKIIWVVGMRIDERFKVTENTKDVLKVRLSVTS